MKNLQVYLSHLPKRFPLIILALMSVFIIGGIAAATFGPDRPTKAYAPGVTGFDYVTFNSFTNVPDIGDERNFFQGQIVGDGVYYDPITDLRDSDEVMVRVYVHNNADESLNSSGEGIAKNTMVKVELPTTSATSHTAKAYVSADNAKPQIIWDELDFTSENGGHFELEPIAGSATMLTNFVDKPINLDNLLNGGVLIGDDALDGEIRGCFEYSALITFKVKVKMPRYTLTKQVRLDGETSADWRETATVKSGETVQWGMEFKNTGSTDLKSVKMVDEVPTSTEVVNDTVMLYNGNYPSGYTFPNSAIQAGGTQVNVDIGNYDPGINAWVLFKTVVDPDNTLGCGIHELINNAYATPEGYGAIRNDAKVIVDNGECETPQSLTCDALNIATIDTNSWKFTAKATAKDGATISGYDFNVNGDSKQDGSSNVFNFATNDPGTYTVQVFVNGKVDGEDVTKTSASCKKTVTVEKEPTDPIYKCESLTAAQSASNRLSFAFTTKVNHSDDVSVNKYIYNFGDGSDKFSTDQNKVTKVYKDYGKYTVGVEVIFNVGDGQESSKCSTTVEVMKTPPPVTPPVTPPTTPPTTELPNTGPATILAGLFGTGALSYGAMSLRASNKGLRNTILGKKED